MKNSKKTKVVRLIIFIIAVMLMIGLTLYLFPVMKNLATPEGQAEFKEKVQNSGIYGFLSLLGLQLAQILFVVLPGEPLEILAGMCYGAVGGTIFILFSVALITTIIFYAVRKYGKEFIYQTFDKQKIDKIENSKIFKNPKNIEYILAILFAITGAPKDILIYIGGLLPIKPLHFILISTFCRLPSIISSTIAGQYFSVGNWKASIGIYALTFGITIIAILIIRFFDKEKVTEKAISELK